MRAIVTVAGLDKVGIIAKVSTVLAAHGINILDINQTVMQDIFTMVMLVDLTEASINYENLVGVLEQVGTEIGMSIRIQREDIFQAMHRIG